MVLGKSITRTLLFFLAFINKFVDSELVVTKYHSFPDEQYKFGLRSCFHRQTEAIIISIAMGVVIPILCGYVTLPLYALITQVKRKENTHPCKIIRFLTKELRYVILIDGYFHGRFCIA